VLADLFGALQRTLREVARRRDDPDRHLAEELRAQRGVGEAADADREIEAALDERDVAIVEVELEAKLGVALAKRGDLRTEQALADGAGIVTRR